MLRFLGGGGARSSSRAGSSRAGSPSRGHKRIRIQLNVPNYGGVFMTRQRHDVQDGPNGELNPPDFMEQELSGELEIEVPKGMGRKRCRAIRLTLRNVCRLNMGPIRGWEEDDLFQRTIEVKGAIILEEGVQR